MDIKRSWEFKIFYGILRAENRTAALLHRVHHDYKIRVRFRVDRFVYNGGHLIRRLRRTDEKLLRQPVPKILC